MIWMNRADSKREFKRLARKRAAWNRRKFEGRWGGLKGIIFQGSLKCCKNNIHIYDIESIDITKVN